MFIVVSIAILITMGLAIARAIAGPTIYDRIAAVNLFGTKTVLLIAILAFVSGRPDLLDIALVYALINFIGVIAVLKLVTAGNFHSSSVDEIQDKEVEIE